MSGAVVHRCSACSNVRMDPLRVYDYLELSRSRIFEWVRPLSAQQYREEHPVGLGSIAQTLHHVMAAEWCYMERIRGRTEPLGELPPEHDPEIGSAEALPFDELESVWREQAKQTGADLARVEDWSRQGVYTSSWDGNPYTYRATPGDVFAQLAFHEVHHRAQLLQMLRRTGVETGDIDYNALMWARVEAS